MKSRNIGSIGLLLVGFCAALALVAGSCNGTGPSQDYVDSALKEASATVDLARLQAEAAKKANAENAAVLEAKAKSAEDLLAKATAAAEAAKDSASVNTDAISGLVTPLTNTLPPPFNVLAALAVGGLLQEIRVRKFKGAAVSIINGISALLAKDPSAKAILDANKGTLLTEYSDTAIKLVEEHKLAS